MLFQEYKPFIDKTFAVRSAEIEEQFAKAKEKGGDAAQLLMADNIREKLGYQKDEATSKQDDVEMSDNQNPQEQKP